MTATDWGSRLDTRIAQLDALAWMTPGMPRANARMIATVVAPSKGGEPGACYVANIACGHVPQFCDRSGPGYVNVYDLERLGVKKVSLTRRRVDDALAEVSGLPQDKIYFGAMELNGSGIRYYGDLCLVLRLAPGDQSPILISNSYDLVREPLAAVTTTKTELVSEARKMMGRWDQDRGKMAALKVFAYRSGERRFTSGQISDGLLDDEDYVEILRHGNFQPREVIEVRVSAASATAEARIADRLWRGPTPKAEALLWLRQRRAAEEALDREGLPVKVVTTGGRVRG